MRAKFTPEQRKMLTAYRLMQRALAILFGYYGMSDPDKILKPLTDSMDAICKRFNLPVR